MSVLLSNGSVVLSAGGLAVASQSSATVSLTRTGSYNVIGEAIEFEATSVTGMDTSETSFVMSDAALDQLVEWEWTITPPGGAATTFTSGSRLMPGHNARMKAYGRWGFIIPDVAGTWTFSVFGVDKNGTPVSASETATVVTRESVVADADTWLLYDGDLTGAPTHNASRRYLSWDALVTALEAHSTAEPVRVQMKGGTSFSVTQRLDANFANITSLILHTYGSGKVTLNMGTTMGVESNFGTPRNLIASGLKFVGNFDAFFETGQGVQAAFSTGNGHTGSASWSIYDCEADGMAYLVFSNSNQIVPYIENCSVTNWSNAAFWLSTLAHIRGTKMEQPSEQPQGGIGGVAVPFGSIRGGGFGIFDANTCFSSAGNNFYIGSDPNRWPLSQPALRIGVVTDANGDGRKNIQRNVLTPGLSVQNAPGDLTNFGPTNCLIERNTIIGNHYPGILEVFCSGTTVRNNFVLGFAGTKNPGNSNPMGIKLGRDTLGADESLNTDTIRVINNTIVDQTAQSGTSLEEAITYNTGATIVTSNNTSYAPNYGTPVQPDGVLTPQAGTTPIAGGARMNFTHHAVQLGSDLTNGNSSAEIPWWTLFDGYDAGANGATFKTRVDASPTDHRLLIGNTQYASGDGLTYTTSNTGVTINNNTGVTIGGSQWIYIQLDLRNDPPGIIPGTASVANDGRLWSVSASPDNSALVPYFDFFGNVRSSGSPTLGAIDPNGT